MGLVSTAGKLFGVKKGKRVHEFYSPELKGAMAGQGRRLEGQADVDRADAASARQRWQADMPRYNRFIDEDISRSEGYQPGGLQERRYDRGIDQYRDAQMGALQDAFGRATAQSKHQQSMMGAGGIMSPYDLANLANQMGAQGRGVAANVSGMRLGNIGRGIDRGMGMFGMRGDMLQNKLRNAMTGFGISGARDRNIQGRTSGLIDQYDKGSWFRQKPDKLNWFGKLAALTGGVKQDINDFSDRSQEGMEAFSKMMGSGGGGGGGGGMSALATMFCWVAREVFGEDNPKWLLFYHWKENQAPRWFRKLYNKHGDKIAVWISDKPRLKSVIRWWMESRINSLNRRNSYANSNI